MLRLQPLTTAAKNQSQAVCTVRLATSSSELFSCSASCFWCSSPDSLAAWHFEALASVRTTNSCHAPDCKRPREPNGVKKTFAVDQCLSDLPCTRHIRHECMAALAALREAFEGSASACTFSSQGSLPGNVPSLSWTPPSHFIVEVAGNETSSRPARTWRGLFCTKCARSLLGKVVFEALFNVDLLACF